MEYKIESIDLSSKRKQRIFDFFVSSLIDPIRKAKEHKKIKLLPYFQKEGEQFLALYLADTLTKFVFYDNYMREIEKLEKLTKEYESNLFYNYSLCKSRGDEMLVYNGVFHKNYSEFLGGRCYFLASQLKFKIDRKVTPTSLILRNLCFYFQEFSNILKNSVPMPPLDKFYK
ncbi:MAG: hypothetical protein K6T16_02710 [Candidatus Pacearchaeota archaeon]|nr:hypothetical protein [Candidatus Pacearchaeota archaeon]